MNRKCVLAVENEFGLNYEVFYPADYAGLPLLVYLHGAGERGRGGNELDKVTIWGFPNVVNDENLQDAILLMPQCPPESFWAARAESLKKFIDTMAEEFAVDKNAGEKENEISTKEKIRVKRIRKIKI